MSDLAEKLAELVAAHNVSMCGNLGVPGMPDRLELKCPTCGPIQDDGRFVFNQHATHVGAVVAAYICGHFTEELLKPIRELHKPSWDNCINACCSGKQCRLRSQICEHCYELWPCPTAKLVYSTEELEP